MTVANPLRSPGDRRLPRVPDPCVLVVFGVTGDLARKKLIPAVYDLANRGLLPAGFVLLGFARRDWGDGDFESLAKEAAREGRPHRVPRVDLVAAVRVDQVPAGQLRRRPRLRQPRPDPARPRRHPRHAGQRGVLPVDPAGGVPDGAQADAAHRHVRQPRVAAAGGGSSSRSRSARPAVVEGAQRPRRRRLHRAGRLPHRPLPRQGDGPEPAGAALRQRAVRADLERPPRRLGADHDGRGRRHRRPRRLLREDRRRPRRPAEPPAAAARAHRDGGAGRLRRREPALGEAQGARRAQAAARPRRLRRPRPVRPGLAGRRAGQGLPRGGGRRRRQPHRDLRRRAPRGRDAALGRRAVLPAHRQAPPPPGHRDRRGVPPGAGAAVHQDRHRDARRQPARRARPARRGRDAALRLQGARHDDGGPRRRDGLPVRRGLHRGQPRGVRAAAARRAARRRVAVPAQRGGRGELAGHRPDRALLGRAGRAGGAPHLYRAGEWGPRRPSEMLARDGRVWRRP